MNYNSANKTICTVYCDKNKEIKALLITVIKLFIQDLEQILVTLYICIWIKVTSTNENLVLGLLFPSVGNISVVKCKNSLHDSLVKNPMPFSSQLNFQRKTMKTCTLL